MFVPLRSMAAFASCALLVSQTALSAEAWHTMEGTCWEKSWFAERTRSRH
jgi:hypothetical protein